MDHEPVLVSPATRDHFTLFVDQVTRAGETFVHISHAEQPKALELYREVGRRIDVLFEAGYHAEMLQASLHAHAEPTLGHRHPYVEGNRSILAPDKVNYDVYGVIKSTSEDGSLHGSVASVSYSDHSMGVPVTISGAMPPQSGILPVMPLAMENETAMDNVSDSVFQSASQSFSFPLQKDLEENAKMVTETPEGDAAFQYEAVADETSLKDHLIHAAASENFDDLGSTGENNSPQAVHFACLLQSESHETKVFPKDNLTFVGTLIANPEKTEPDFDLPQSDTKNLREKTVTVCEQDFDRMKLLEAEGMILKEKLWHWTKTNKKNSVMYDETPEGVVTQILDELVEKSVFMSELHVVENLDDLLINTTLPQKQRIKFENISGQTEKAAVKMEQDLQPKKDRKYLAKPASPISSRLQKSRIQTRSHSRWTKQEAAIKAAKRKNPNPKKVIKAENNKSVYSIQNTASAIKHVKRAKVVNTNEPGLDLTKNKVREPSEKAKSSKRTLLTKIKIKMPKEKLQSVDANELDAPMEITPLASAAKKDKTSCLPLYKKDENYVGQSDDDSDHKLKIVLQNEDEEQTKVKLVRPKAKSQPRQTSQRLGRSKQSTKIIQRQYTCCICQEVFNKMALLREHLKTHPDSQELSNLTSECKVCNMKFVSNKALRKHLQTFSHNMKAGKAPTKKKKVPTATLR